MSHNPAQYDTAQYVSPRGNPAYAVTLIAAAPTATLESVRAELLDTATLYGFTDVSVGQDLNRFGACYWAAAHGVCRTGLTLANCLDSHTLEDMRATAFATLHALGNGCSQL